MLFHRCTTYSRGVLVRSVAAGHANAYAMHTHVRDRPRLRCHKYRGTDVRRTGSFVFRLVSDVGRVCRALSSVHVECVLRKPRNVITIAALLCVH